MDVDLKLSYEQANFTQRFDWKRHFQFTITKKNKNTDTHICTFNIKTINVSLAAMKNWLSKAQHWKMPHYKSAQTVKILKLIINNVYLLDSNLNSLLD